MSTVNCSVTVSTSYLRVLQIATATPLSFQLGQQTHDGADSQTIRCLHLSCAVRHHCSAARYTHFFSLLPIALPTSADKNAHTHRAADDFSSSDNGTSWASVSRAAVPLLALLAATSGIALLVRLLRRYACRSHQPNTVRCSLLLKHDVQFLYSCHLLGCCWIVPNASIVCIIASICLFRSSGLLR